MLIYGWLFCDQQRIIFLPVIMLGIGHYNHTFTMVLGLWVNHPFKAMRAKGKVTFLSIGKF
jgi:hypothetical protein